MTQKSKYHLVLNQIVWFCDLNYIIYNLCKISYIQSILWSSESAFNSSKSDWNNLVGEDITRWKICKGIPQRLLLEFNLSTFSTESLDIWWRIFELGKNRLFLECAKDRTFIFFVAYHIMRMSIKILSDPWKEPSIIMLGYLPYCTTSCLLLFWRWACARLFHRPNLY